MSHVRPEDRTERHKRSNCRRGRHSYGEDQNIGAGIIRRVCDTCGAVNIDLSETEVSRPVLRTNENILKLIGRKA